MRSNYSLSRRTPVGAHVLLCLTQTTPLHQINPLPPLQFTPTLCSPCPIPEPVALVKRCVAQQEKLFKPRACNTRTPAKSVRVQGFQMAVRTPLHDLDSLRPQIRQELANLIAKRSGDMTESATGSSTHKRSNLSTNFRNKPAPIRGRTLEVKRNDKAVADAQLLGSQHLELECLPCNLGGLLSIARRTNLTLNAQCSGSPHSRFSLVFSLTLLCREPTKSNLLSNRQVAFSAQTDSSLRALCGPQQEGSFLNHCKLYLKVQDEVQKDQLTTFLTDNRLYGWAGIMIPQQKGIESTHCLSLRGIGSPEDNIIYIEDRHVLSQEVPVAQGRKIVILSAHPDSSSSLNRLITAIRGIVMSPHSPTKHPRLDLSSDSEKENLSPNRYHLRLARKSVKRSEYNSSPSKIQRTLRILMRAPLKVKDLQCNLHLLGEKAKAALISKRIRQKNSLSEGFLFEYSKRADNDKPSLEGVFKDKMVSLVKILEAEYRMRPQLKEEVIDRSIKEREDPIEELTHCITSRVSGRTSFQMVGQLLRNNAHIARQVGAHLKSIPQQFCQEYLQPELEIKLPHSIQVFDYE